MCERKHLIHKVYEYGHKTLVHQCQKALNNISAWHAMGLFWVPGHAGIQGNEITDGPMRGGSALSFFRP